MIGKMIPHYKIIERIGGSGRLFIIGKTISQYEILEKFGLGGKGVVFDAQDTKLDCDVSIKLLSYDFEELL